MPFGLKKFEATYQHLVNKMFKDQLEKNMEAYEYDMVIKFVHLVDCIKDLKEVFEIIRKYGMRLNPIKCVFGITLRKFLGYLISAHGIKANTNRSRP